MTKELFFEKLASGTSWSAGVSFQRSNPLPLEKYSVFGSKADADAYLTNAVCYPGQVVAVIENILGEDEAVIGVKTTVYVIEVDKDGAYSYKEVGTKPVGDDCSIEVAEDGTVSIFGFADATDGYLPQKLNGKVEWVPISAVVQGDGNTVTSGDGNGIVTSGDDKTLTAKLVGFDDAADGQIAYKKDGKLAWKTEYSYDDTDVKADIEALENKVDVTGKVSEAIDEAASTAKSEAITAAAEDAASKYVAKDGYVEFTQTEKDKLAGLENYNDKAVTDRLTTAEGDIDAAEGRLNTIEADYLKAADKTEIETAYKAADKELSDRLDTVEVFFKEEKVEGALDTLHEIQNYITTDGQAAAELAAEVAANTGDIATLKEDVADIKEDYLKKADYKEYDDAEVRKGIQDNKTAIEAINDADTGILHEAKAYTDGKASDLTARIDSNSKAVSDAQTAAQEFATAEATKAQTAAEKTASDALASAKEELEGSIKAVDDKLVDYAKQAKVDEDLAAVNAKFDDYTLTTELEERLAGIDEAVDSKAAQTDLDALQQQVDALAGIKSIDESQLSISDAGMLSITAITQDKVAGLTSDLASKVSRQTSKVTVGDQEIEKEWILLSPENQAKLEALVIGDEGVEISGKVNAENVEGLGSYITTNRDSIEGLFSTQAQTKLDGIENGAQVNVLTGIKLAGATENLVANNKVITIPYATSSIAGLVKSSTAADKVSVGADGTMTVNSLNVNKLTQTEGETLILNGGSASA